MKAPFSSVSLLSLMLALNGCAGHSTQPESPSSSPAADSMDPEEGEEAAPDPLSPNEFQAKHDAVGGVLLDVRTPEEVAEGHLPGAQNINFKADDFDEQASQLNKEQPVFTYCRSGGRSSAAAKRLREMGFSEVYDLDGGITAWREAELPIDQPGDD